METTISGVVLIRWAALQNHLLNENLWYRYYQKADYPVIEYLDRLSLAGFSPLFKNTGRPPRQQPRPHYSSDRSFQILTMQALNILGIQPQT